MILPFSKGDYMNLAISNFQDVLTLYKTLEKNDFQIRDIAFEPYEDLSEEQVQKGKKLLPLVISFLEAMEAYYASIDAEGHTSFNATRLTFIDTLDTWDEDLSEPEEVDAWIEPIRLVKFAETRKDELPPHAHLAKKVEETFNVTMQFLKTANDDKSQEEFPAICTELMGALRDYWQADIEVRQAYIDSPQ
jgi:hypothetical protein